MKRITVEITFHDDAADPEFGDTVDAARVERAIHAGFPFALSSLIEVVEVPTAARSYSVKMTDNCGNELGGLVTPDPVEADEGFRDFLEDGPTGVTVSLVERLHVAERNETRLISAGKGGRQ